jgi:hypothetical protein
LEDLVPGYQHRLSVKPGVTGLAQVQLPADTDITSVRHKVVYDLYYVQNQGLLQLVDDVVFEREREVSFGTRALDFGCGTGRSQAGQSSERAWTTTLLRE